MKKVVFIIALVCIILLFIFGSGVLNVLAAEYEDDGSTFIETVEKMDEFYKENRLIFTKVEPSQDAIMLARLVCGEAGGIYSITEQACVMWTVLNRVDAGYGDTIAEVITAPGQYYYISSSGTTDGFGRDLILLAEDVIDRWQREKNGETDVGRVLPSDYLWFAGDGSHNYFRNSFSGDSSRWDYSLPSPYES